jgi:hypothetical protein
MIKLDKADPWALTTAIETELTIASGAITPVFACHSIDTEGDAASDDLDTIAASYDTAILLLRMAHPDRQVTLRHNTGNLLLPNAANITLNPTTQLHITLWYSTNLSKWLGLDSAFFLLRDLFTTTRAVGSVHNTPAEPGPGTRTVVDTESKLSIASGQLSLSGGRATPAYGDPLFYLNPSARTAGRMMLSSLTLTSGGCRWGWYSSGMMRNGFFLGIGGGFTIDIVDNNVANSAIAPAPTAGTPYQLACILRQAGQYYFIKGGIYTAWTLLAIRATSTIASANPAIDNYTAVLTMDNLRVPARLWLPTPLVYDTFTRADGALGNSESTGPDSQTVTARAWTNQVGTVQVASNTAICTALSGGIAIATVDAGAADVLHQAALTRGTGTPGIVVRYADASNYVYAIHDGTNARLIKRVAASETTLVNIAATYAANAPLLIMCSGTAFRLYYNNAFIGTQQTISDASLQTGTQHGLYYTDTNSTLDTMQTFARGTADEYAALDTM